MQSTKNIHGESKSRIGKSSHEQSSNSVYSLLLDVLIGVVMGLHYTRVRRVELFNECVCFYLKPKAPRLNSSLGLMLISMSSFRFGTLVELVCNPVEYIDA